MAVVETDFPNEDVALGFCEEWDHFAGVDECVCVIIVGEINFVFVFGEMGLEGIGFGLIDELYMDGLIALRVYGVDFV